MKPTPAALLQIQILSKIIINCIYLIAFFFEFSKWFSLNYNNSRQMISLSSILPCEDYTSHNSAFQSYFLSGQVIQYLLVFQSHCSCEFNIFSRKAIRGGSSIWLSSQCDVQRRFIVFAEGCSWAL